MLPLMASIKLHIKTEIIQHSRSTFSQCTRISGHVHRPRQGSIWQACRVTSALCLSLCAALARLYPSHSHRGTYADGGGETGEKVGKVGASASPVTYAKSPNGGMPRCKKNSKKRKTLAWQCSLDAVAFPLSFCSFLAITYKCSLSGFRSVLLVCHC